MKYNRGSGICHHCDTWFGNDNPNKMYCNVVCRNAAHRERQRQQRPKITSQIVCTECAERFDVTERQAAQRPLYCGSTCRKRASRREKAKANGGLYTPSVAHQKRYAQFKHLES